jgi:hypothetical protein
MSQSYKNMVQRSIAITGSRSQESLPQTFMEIGRHPTEEIAWVGALQAETKVQRDTFSETGAKTARTERWKRPDHVGLGGPLSWDFS